MSDVYGFYACAFTLRVFGNFINIFIRTASGFHRLTKHSELNFVVRNISSRWSNQTTKIIPIASQFSWGPALNKSVRVLYVYERSSFGGPSPFGV